MDTKPVSSAEALLAGPIADTIRWALEHDEEPDIAGLKALFKRIDPEDIDDLEEELRRDHERKLGRASRPETIGPFEIVREIGRGGMGVVYEAKEEAPNRTVALKVIDEKAGAGGTGEFQALARYLVEINSLARLRHEGIVSVFTSGEENDLLYYSMTYVRGASLGEVIHALCALRGNPTAKKVTRYRPIEIARAIDSGPGRAEFYRAVADLGLQAARALDHAHRNGVIHCDVKPDNLLVEEADGRIRLYVSDFGLSKAVGEPPSGARIGTLPYMSPEQSHGRQEVSKRTDIYSLSATLYELVTLERLIPPGDETAMHDQIAKGIWRAPREVDEHIPWALEKIILIGLSRDAEHRYETAAAMADDLERFLKGQVIVGKNLTLRERAKEWRRLNEQKLIAAVGALCVILCVATMLAFAHVRRLDAARRTARAAEAVAVTERDQAERGLYASRLALAQLAAREHRSDRLASLLFLTSPQPGEPDRRGWEWYYLRSLDRRRCAVFARRGTELTAGALSPDGSLVALARRSQTSSGTSRDESETRVEVRDVSTGNLRIELSVMQRGPAVALAWSPDARMLAAVDVRGTVVVWIVAIREIAFERSPLAPARDLDTASLAWSRDSLRLTAVRGEHVTSWTLPDGEESFDLSPQDRGVIPQYARPIAVATLADGRTALSYRFETRIRVIDVATGAEIAAAEARDAASKILHDVSPDGTKQVVARGDEQSVAAIGSHGGVAFAYFQDHEASVSAVAFSPDGHRVASGDRSGSICIWDAAFGRLIERKSGHVGGVRALAWDRGGQVLLSLDESYGTARVWTLGEIREVLAIDAHASIRVPPHRDGPILEFSPDGRQIATLAPGSHDRDLTHELRTFDTTTGDLVSLTAWDPERQAGAIHWEGDRLADLPTEGSVRAAAANPALGGDDLKRLKPDGVYGIRCAARHPGGSRLAAGGFDGTVGIFDATSGSLLVELKHPRRRWIVAVAWSADGDRLAALDEEGFIAIFDASAGYRAGDLATAE